ncbi:MAG: hypothetical protein M1820_009140 [Bogoriella megaspora]|nr:MAG: hypothetical protein M1820_009140 [Bogoriella megaspora]
MTGDFCGNYSTVTPEETGLFEARALGTTFTSGTVYISYPAYSVVAHSGGQCGPTVPAGILGLPSTEVSSIRGFWSSDIGATQLHFTLYSMNFADLYPNPVPASAWFGQYTCNQREDWPACATITEANYVPLISYPSELVNIDPRWSTCQFDMLALPDPPYALTQQIIAHAPTPVSIPLAPVDPTPHPNPFHPSLAPSTGNWLSVPKPTQTAGPSIGLGKPLPIKSPSPPEDPSYPKSLSHLDHSSASNDPTSPNKPSPQDHTLFPHFPPLDSDPKDPGAIVASLLQTGAWHADNPSTGSIADDHAHNWGSNAAGLRAPNEGDKSHVSEADPVNINTPFSDALNLEDTNGDNNPQIETFSPLDPATESAVHGYTINSEGNLVIGTHTLTPSSNTIISGQRVSFDYGRIQVNGQTLSPPSGAAKAAEGIVGIITTVNGQILTAVANTGSGFFTVDGKILEIGGQPKTIGSGSDGLPLVVGVASDGLVYSTPGGKQTTAMFSTLPSDELAGVFSFLISGVRSVILDSDTEDMGAVVTLGSRKMTAWEEAPRSGGGDASIVILGSQTLTIGGKAITVDRETMSADASGLLIGMGGKTQTAPFSAILETEAVLKAIGEAKLDKGLASSARGLLLTIGTSTYTALEMSTTSRSSDIMLFGEETYIVRGTPTTLGGDTLVALSDGLIVGNQGSTTTMHFSNWVAGVAAEALQTAEANGATTGGKGGGSFQTPDAGVTTGSLSTTAIAKASGSFSGIRLAHRLSGIALVGLMLYF